MRVLDDLIDDPTEDLIEDLIEALIDGLSDLGLSDNDKCAFVKGLVLARRRTPLVRLLSHESLSDMTKHHLVTTLLSRTGDGESPKQLSNEDLVDSYLRSFDIFHR